jgi:oligopeptide/dipeptide ABC transporter ATP-binding protein
VTIQAQILELMTDLQARISMSILMITHDLGVIAETADRVIVMYCGRIVEAARARALFHEPLHPYSRQLLLSIPRLSATSGRLKEIPGMVPSLYDTPNGCSFHPRCAEAGEACSRLEPQLVEAAQDHWVACHRTHGGGR